MSEKIPTFEEIQEARRKNKEEYKAGRLSSNQFLAVGKKLKAIIREHYPNEIVRDENIKPRAIKCLLDNHFNERQIRRLLSLSIKSYNNVLEDLQREDNLLMLEKLKKSGISLQDLDEFNKWKKQNANMDED